MRSMSNRDFKKRLEEEKGIKRLKDAGTDM